MNDRSQPILIKPDHGGYVLAEELCSRAALCSMIYSKDISMSGVALVRRQPLLALQIYLVDKNKNQKNSPLRGYSKFTWPQHGFRCEIQLRRLDL